MCQLAYQRALMAIKILVLFKLEEIVVILFYIQYFKYFMMLLKIKPRFIPLDLTFTQMIDNTFLE